MGIKGILGKCIFTFREIFSKTAKLGSLIYSLNLVVNPPCSSISNDLILLTFKYRLMAWREGRVGVVFPGKVARFLRLFITKIPPAVSRVIINEPNKIVLPGPKPLL